MGGAGTGQLPLLGEEKNIEGGGDPPKQQPREQFSDPLENKEKGIMVGGGNQRGAAFIKGGEKVMKQKRHN